MAPSHARGRARRVAERRFFAALGRGAASPALTGAAGASPLSAQSSPPTEVTRLTRFHVASPDGGAAASPLAFTTALGAAGWGERVRRSARARERAAFAAARPDLDAVAEHYALRKLHAEQARPRRPRRPRLGARPAWGGSLGGSARAVRGM